MGMVVVAAVFGIIILAVISHGIYLMLEREKRKKGLHREEDPDNGDREEP